MREPEQKQEAESTSPPRPWWRERMMWLVVGGPGAVVLASFVTLGLALRYPDPVIDTTAQSRAQAEAAAALTPAMKARNHAATGGK